MAEFGKNLSFIIKTSKTFYVGLKESSQNVKDI